MNGLEDFLRRYPELRPRPLKREDVPIVFVAVHGIGDQFRFETIQSVAYRVCDYVGEPAAIPLGRYHDDEMTITGAYLPTKGRDPSIGCAFAEMYWADLPREQVADRYILEESKKWARTLVERLELRDREEIRRYIDEHPRVPPGARTATSTRIIQAWKEKTLHENALLEQVIEQLIEGVIVGDRLAFLASRAGLFEFDLKRLLTDYLGDVQVVTEFTGLRQKLLRGFRRLMELLAKIHPRARIYVVAHSEGTVVALLGLLKGLVEGDPWTESVRGLMTIGSPLNKHIRLWPELFEEVIGASDEARLASVVRGRESAGHPPIQWRNYFDWGDPIAFNLRPTRAWLREKGLGGLFEFRGLEDVRALRRRREAGERIQEARRIDAEAGSMIDAALREAQMAQQEALDAAGAGAEIARESATRNLFETILEWIARIRRRDAIEDLSVRANHAEERADSTVRLQTKLRGAISAAEEALAQARSDAEGPHPLPSADEAVKRADAAILEASRLAWQFDLARPRPPKRSNEDDSFWHDIGFSRYFFPGAAHLGYWGDSSVFGHFLATVVDPGGQHLRPASGAPEGTDESILRANEQRWRPENLWAAMVTSYAFPYVLSAVMLFLGVLLLYKAVRGYLVPEGARLESVADVGRNVLGLSALIAGMSLLARIPRLIRKSSLTGIVQRRRRALDSLGWRMLAVLLALLSLGYFAVSEANRRSIERVITSRPAQPAAWYRFLPLGRPEGLVLLVLVVAFVAMFAIARMAPTRWARALEEDRFLRHFKTLIPVMWVLGLAVSCLMGLRLWTPPGRFSFEPWKVDLSVAVVAPFFFLSLRLIHGRFPRKVWLIFLGVALLGAWALLRGIGSASIPTDRYDLRLMPWGDGSEVPTSGRHLAILGTDGENRLHLRVFDASGDRVVDTDEGRLPGTNERAVAALKVKVLDRLSTGAPPDASSPAGAPPDAREGQVLLGEAMSILGQPWTSLGIIVLAWVIGVGAWVVSREYPSVGLKPLLYTGALVVLSIVLVEIAQDPAPTEAARRRESEARIDRMVQRLAARPDLLRAAPGRNREAQALREHLRADMRDLAALEGAGANEPSRGPLWPVALAGPAFLYLWWLAALLFDLTFVWHLYIRWQGARNYIDDRRQVARAFVDDWLGGAR